MGSVYSGYMDLIAVLDDDDKRLRLRVVLKRIVESIQLLVGKHGRARLAIVDVRLTSGLCHSFCIKYVPVQGNGSAKKDGR